ncbi:MAG: APC family permease, partial [Cyanobium sp.]
AVAAADAGAVPGGESLKRCLGPVAVTAQAVATIGLTLTAVINIPEAMHGAGRATWISYLIALAAVLLVCETLVLFRRLPAGPSGIAGYVESGLGSRAAALATWALLLGYGATLLACLAFFGSYLDRVLLHLGLHSPQVVGFLLGGLACFELARRDVQLSTRLMLLTEGISVLIVLGLTALVLLHGGAKADLQAIDPLGDSLTQVRAGLMVAVLSFIGFESAANLGSEAIDPEQSVPRAMRLAVGAAGLLFLVWAVVLPEGLSWLPAQERLSLDPISDLAERLGQPGAGLWIKVGAFLCLFGSSLGSLTALARVAYALAQKRLLPARLARAHPRFSTPAAALGAVALPVIGGGALAVLRGLDASELFDLFGGFSVLGFLLVYGLVALSSLRTPLPGIPGRRRWLVGGSCLLAMAGVALGYLSSVVGQQNAMVLTFAALLLVGWLRVIRVVPADPPAD